MARTTAILARCAWLGLWLALLFAKPLCFGLALSLNLLLPLLLDLTATLLGSLALPLLIDLTLPQLILLLLLQVELPLALLHELLLMLLLELSLPQPLLLALMLKRRGLGGFRSGLHRRRCQGLARGGRLRVWRRRVLRFWHQRLGRVRLARETSTGQRCFARRTDCLAQRLRPRRRFRYRLLQIWLSDQGLHSGR